MALAGGEGEAAIGVAEFQAPAFGCGSAGPAIATE